MMILNEMKLLIIYLNDCIVLIDEFYNNYKSDKYFNLLQNIDGVHENRNVIIFIPSNSLDQHLNEKTKIYFNQEGLMIFHFLVLQLFLKQKI